ncbi:MAG: iron-sulfur cluster assembly accessory protein [Methylophilaceae bacterium]|nr:iron-sulfur cluster assembly accessory protein [Methylophilaceae bacterium]
MELTITPKAEKFIARMLRFNGGTPEHGFRLCVSPGGCSGLSSEFTVEVAPLQGDAIVLASGLRLFLPAESRILLEGATIDFKDTPMESGLTFITQQSAGGSCGSGSGGSCSSSSGDGHSHGEHAGQSTISLDSIQRKY